MIIDNYDDFISQQLNNTLSKNIDPRSISNSLILNNNANNKNGAILIYFSKLIDKYQSLVLVAVNLSNNSSKSKVSQNNQKQENKSSAVNIVPVNIKNQLISYRNVYFEIKQCSFVADLFIVSIYDTTYQEKKYIKQVMLMNLDFDQLSGKAKSNKTPGENQGIELICILSKKQSRGYQEQEIKDVQWHPFSPLTLLILQSQRLLVYKIDKNPYEPQYKLLLSSLKSSNSSQIISSKNYFEKILFVNPSAQSSQYSSLGRKLSLFLISNTGMIYLLFPFVIQYSGSLVISNKQRQYFQQLIYRPRGTRSVQMSTLFKHHSISKIEQEGYNKSSQINHAQSQQSNQYALQLQCPEYLEQIQVFKLNNQSENNRRQQSVFPEKYLSIQNFSSIYIGHHTLFIISLITKQPQSKGILKLLILTEDPYQKLLKSQSYKKSQNFYIQTISQMLINNIFNQKQKSYQSSNQNQNNQNQYDSNYQNGSLMEIFIRTTIANTNHISFNGVGRNKNQIYLLANHSNCYKLSLQGLERFLNDNQANLNYNAQELSDTKLVEVDMLFQSSPKISLVTNFMTQDSFYLIRYQNRKYTFNSIPLQSIQLKQKIRKTNDQTQQLFRKLKDQMDKKKIQINKQLKQTEKKVEISEFKQTTIAEIQTKIQTFTQEYRKMIEHKLQRIRNIYEQIRLKNIKVQELNERKKYISQKIKLAQQNDKEIKELVTAQVKTQGKTQKQLNRRLVAADKLLKQLKDKFDIEIRKVQQDKKREDMIEIMNDCEEQVDIVLNNLKDMKEKLIRTKQALLKRKGY